MHAELSNKDLKAFQKAIDEVIAEAEANNRFCDFSHVHFPSLYKCHGLSRALKLDCKFYKAKFYGYVDFGRVSFEGNISFQGAEFAEWANFEKAKFLKEANFEGTEFKSSAIFVGAEFHEKVSFWRSVLSEMADFSEVQCHKSANFEEVKFHGHVYFMRATFSSQASFSKIHTEEKAEIMFSEVHFLKPREAQFYHNDITRWIFGSTDLTQVDFENISSKNGKTRLIIYDEILVYSKIRSYKQAGRGNNIEVEPGQDRIELAARVERLYRQLRKNFESKGDYSRAGDFYYGEMEMKRLQQNVLQQIPFWIYRILSGYGESYHRALLVLIGMWLLFATLFMFLGYTQKETGIIVDRDILTWNFVMWRETLADWGRSLAYAALSMTLLHDPPIAFHTIGGEVVKLMASVLGVLQIALFGLALKRRFKR